MTTAADIRAGVWVRFPQARDEWWYVKAARHGDGYVSYDGAAWPGGFTGLGGFAVHDEPCRVVTVTPEVTA